MPAGLFAIWKPCLAPCSFSCAAFLAIGQSHAQLPVNATSGCLQQSWCSTSRQLQHKCRAGQLPSLLSCRQLVQHRRSSGQHGGDERRALGAGQLHQAAGHRCSSSGQHGGDERRALGAGQVGGHPGQRLQPGRVLLQVWPLAGSRGGGAARAGGETAGGGGPVRSTAPPESVAARPARSPLSASQLRRTSCPTRSRPNTRNISCTTTATWMSAGGIEGGASEDGWGGGSPERAAFASAGGPRPRRSTAAAPRCAAPPCPSGSQQHPEQPAHPAHPPR